jgi:hypothetical protein
MSLKAPVAWAVMNDQGVVFDIRVTNPPYMKPIVTGMETPIPLYLSPTLTEAEREAIEEAMRQVKESDCIATHYALEVAETLRKLLERTK